MTQNNIHLFPLRTELIPDDFDKTSQTCATDLFTSQCLLNSGNYE